MMYVYYILCTIYLTCCVSRTYGTVYKALDKDTKKIVALKRIIMHNEKHDGFPLTSIREIDTLRRTDHPNCVKMLDVVVGHKRDGTLMIYMRSY
jgi:serine/threonine protein kinase